MDGNLLRYALFEILIFLASGVFSQSGTNLTIVDFNSKEPVSYVQVSTGSSVFYADINGLINKSLLNADTIILSRVGYEPIIIPFSSTNDTIYLKPSINHLPQITITGEKNHVEIGFHRSKTKGKYTSRIINNKSSIESLATLVKDDELTGEIVTVIVHLYKQKKGRDYIVSLFQVDEDGRPGELLFSKKCVSSNNRNHLKVGVKEAGIDFLSDGVFVGIHPLLTEENPAFTILLTQVQTDSMSYFFSQNFWYPIFNPNKNFLTAYKIGLEIVPF